MHRIHDHSDLGERVIELKNLDHGDAGDTGAGISTDEIPVAPAAPSCPISRGFLP